MKKLILIPIFPALLLLGACQKEMNPKNQDREIQARSGKPSGGTKLTAVLLNVTIDAMNGISNDGKEGAYSNAVDRVSATIRDTDGQFFFRTNTQFKPRLRWLTFPFIAASLDDKDDYRIVTYFPQPLQTMEQGEAGAQTGGGMRIWAYVDKGTEAFAMRYYYDVATGNPNPATSRVKVTRTDANTWVIEPLELAGKVTAELKIGTGSFALHNNVPFRIVLTKK